MFYKLSTTYWSENVFHTLAINMTNHIYQILTISGPTDKAGLDFWICDNKEINHQVFFLIYPEIYQCKTLYVQHFVDS